jgi:hypothetical protein
VLLSQLIYHPQIVKNDQAGGVSEQSAYQAACSVPRQKEVLPGLVPEGHICGIPKLKPHDPRHWEGGLAGVWNPFCIVRLPHVFRHGELPKEYL